MAKYKLVPVNYDPWANLPKGETALSQGPMSARDYLPFIGEAIKQLVTNKLQQTSEALALPGNVLQGRIDPTSEVGFAQAQGLAGLLPIAGIPMAKPNSIGLFGGRLDPAALSAAREMESSGLPRRTIWEDTGLFRAPDRRWRNEIPDVGVQYKEPFNPYVKEPITSYVAHPTAFNTYPELKNLRLRETYTGQGEAGALADAGKTVELERTMSVERKKNILLHELQHAIQGIEGFEGGANPDMFKDIRERFPAIYNARILGAAEIAKQSGDPESWVKGTQWSAADANKIIKLAKTTSEKELLDLQNRFAQALPMSNTEAYRRVAGEVEARNVQKRYQDALRYGQDYYKLVPPWETQEYPDAFQLFSLPGQGKMLTTDRKYMIGPRGLEQYP